jgi:DeoR family transcriptional regulator of aga operon
MAGHILDQINATTAFIGCNGIHPEGGVTNVNLPEAGVKRRMMDSAQRCVVVGDGSKVGNVSVVKIAELADFDLVITGQSAPQAHVEEIHAQGIEIRIAGDGKEQTET